MCMIIYKPAGKEVAKKDLALAFSNNPNGVGFMYVRNGQVKIEKPFYKFKPFYKRFRQAERENLLSGFVIHFRLATSGTLGKDNVHPFYVNKSVAFCHNGIFAGLGNKKVSDTVEFNIKYLQHLPNNFLDNSAIKSLIEKICIDSHSKLVFLDYRNRVFIFNENAGEWRKDGCWYSNKEIKQIVGFNGYLYDLSYKPIVEEKEYDTCDYCYGRFDNSELITVEYGLKLCYACYTDHIMIYGNKK